MPAIVRYPTVVQEALERFGPLMNHPAERLHLGDYLTGLLVADQKNVAAITREFALTTDQSCLNRFLTCAPWDVAQLNAARLAWLQEEPTCRYHERGVIALDNVLLDHAGELIQDVGWFWDHAEKRYTLAHDYLIANYVCPSGKHYPLEFRRFVKEEQCVQEQRPFHDHQALFRELVDFVADRNIPGVLTFDCWFTCAENLNHIQGQHRDYVGDLKFNRTVLFQGREVKAADLARRLPPDLRKPVTLGENKQWYFTKSLRLPEVHHPVRLVILWERYDAVEACKMLVTNRTNWEITRILRAYRSRWTGTECFHRDGKQNLGLGDCQLRNGQGQTRHMYLVFLAYSLLMRSLRPGRVCGWALQRLTTIGQACRATLKETYRQTVDWIVQHLQVEQWTPERIKTHLALN